MQEKVQLQVWGFFVVIFFFLVVISGTSASYNWRYILSITAPIPCDHEMA